MRRFIRENKILFTCAVMSMIVIILYLYSFEKSEWFSHAGEWFRVLCQLALGYEINFVFYITQVYIPRQRQMRQVYQCMNIRMTDLINHMRDTVYRIALRYDDKFDEHNLTDQELLDVFRKFSIDDRVMLIDPRRAYPSVDEDSYYTVKEWIISQVGCVEKDINQLYSYYTQYINPDLMSIMDDILKSFMHVGLARTLLQTPNGISFSEWDTDILFKPYLEYARKLEEIKKEYQSE